jgi:hypothetical protein
VRIRRRKPCVLARRRLFGWYVRLLTAISGCRLALGWGVTGRPPRLRHWCSGLLGGPRSSSHRQGAVVDLVNPCTVREPPERGQFGLRRRPVGVRRPFSRSHPDGLVRLGHDLSGRHAAGHAARPGPIGSGTVTACGELLADGVRTLLASRLLTPRTPHSDPSFHSTPAASPAPGTFRLAPVTGPRSRVFSCTSCG